ncbi:enoyl-CoA hydratase/isomerase family protein [Paraburkholderia solisilvae]|jgi:enoyl-CoA hydratase/carnithine racemase|uniref:3-hydroxyisobutyryl-CoA hydrolase n=1 Tax=Paraburkholderia solisilvae TaxID=624376 RepID=A0A6J5E2D8_9BURK|nr:enoyl-CoA hydratase/isomerase family protein [Paraburkholderia solisilvae]CAB3760187.1 1,4-dihydroxy-2-naphthoyl-CoA synthase [Paraburkholderia solisilvae]
MKVAIEKMEWVYAEPTVLLRIVNRVAIITLNRPQALNALSHHMVKALSDLLRRCRIDDGIVAVVLEAAGEKAFCAGGDVRELYQRARKNDQAWLQFFVDEYRLDYALHKFPKPVVAILDGVTMGGGMGLAQGAWLRVVTERTRMAMPEARIGLIPDVGATSFMTKMPIEVALYFALTGASLNGADALMWNLADLHVSSEWLSTFEERLMAVPPSNLDPSFPDRLKRALREVFDAGASHAGRAPTRTLAPLIKCFFDPRMRIENIVGKLKDRVAINKGSEAAQWIETTVTALEQHSPTMLYVTREMMLRGRCASLGSCFRMELGCVSKAINDGDFVEGVRAHLVDKDRKPRWAPASVWEVRPERVQYFLASPWRVDEHPLRDIEILHP